MFKLDSGDHEINFRLDHRNISSESNKPVTLLIVISFENQYIIWKTNFPFNGCFRFERTFGRARAWH